MEKKKKIKFTKEIMYKLGNRSWDRLSLMSYIMYIVCIVHMYVLLISGKTAQLKSLLANFFCLIEDQMFCLILVGMS